jgi:sulfate permease, SulP family
MRTISELRGDLYGGATAAVVALPLALAFGVASGAGPLAGLYGAIFAGFFAAILGGTRLQITGPTGPMTVVMALIVTHFAGNPAAAFAVVMLAGVFQVIFGKMGLGRFINLTPQPVVSGFMSGIGVIIIIVQFAPILGHPEPHGSVLEKLVAVPGLLSNVNLHALMLAAAVLLLLFLTPDRLAKFAPPPLIALIAGSAAAYFFFPDVPVIGDIPSGLPSLIIPDLEVADIQYVIRFALMLAFLGSIDSLLTSIVVDSITRTQHDSNRELVGQGIGNIAAGLVGGLPSAGATMRSLVNVRAGGVSRLSGAIHSTLLFLIVLGFGQVVQHIPLSVLAGILLKVGLDIIDWGAIKRVFSAPRASVFIMLSTLLVTVLVDLITAVAVGFVMASVLFVARTADAQVKGARFLFGADQIDDLSSAEEALLEACNKRLVLFHMEGPLSFGSARDIARLMQSDIDKDVLAIDLRHVPFIDSSASAALDEVIERLAEEEDVVVLFGVREAVRSMLEKTGVLNRLGHEHIFSDRFAALTFAKAYIVRRHGASPDKSVEREI